MCTKEVLEKLYETRDIYDMTSHEKKEKYIFSNHMEVQ